MNAGNFLTTVCVLQAFSESVTSTVFIFKTSHLEAARREKFI